MLSGLPLHPLVVHAVVALVPLAAFGTILIALWPAAARRFWPAVLFVATLALAAVPLAIGSGEALEDRVPETPLIETHAEQGELVLPFAVMLWVAAVGISASAYVTGRTARVHAGAGQGEGADREAARRRSTWRIGAAVALAVLALLGGVGGTFAMVVSGHSGAQAVWKK